MQPPVMPPPDDPAALVVTQVVTEGAPGTETSSDEIIVIPAEPGEPTEAGADAEPATDAEPMLAGDDIEILTEPAEPRVANHPPSVDPRIRARRIAVAREQGRRRLRVVLVGLGLFVIVGSAWLFVRSPFLDVDHIVVTGVPQARVAQVLAASGVKRSDPLLLVSTGAVARRIERVPGIGSVHVTRDLPGTLRISAREQGVALWVRVPGNGVALVGHDGRVQRVAAAVPPNVVELRGLTRVPAPGRRLPIPSVVDVVAQLPPTFAQRVGAISAASPTDVRLYLKAGGEVRLGDLSLVHDKGVAAESVIERMNCALTYIDLRSISNPVALPAPGANCIP